MSEEIKKTDAEVESEKNASDYIEALATLKKNSVPKKEYEALLEERKSLINAVVNGTTVPLEGQDEPKIDIEQIDKELWCEDNCKSNYENFKLLMTERNELIKRGGRDIFLPYGRKPNGDILVPSEDDIIKANHLAEYIQNCLDVADGDPDIFQNEFQRHLN